MHVGMLADQYYVRGVDVMFFGRRTKANPLIARLARQIDCPIHGVRVIRLPGRRFPGELTEAIEPVRDAQGKIDVAGTMQAITSSLNPGCANIPSSGCGCTAAGGEPHPPVFTRVHSRLMTRCVRASLALIVNRCAIVAFGG